MTLHHLPADHASLFCHYLEVQDRTGKVNAIDHAKDDPRTTIFAGAAKAYETFGAKLISNRLKCAGTVWISMLLA